MKKRIASVLALCALVCRISAPAAAAPAPPETSGKSAILADYYGNVVFEVNSHDRLPPASVTKIMTLLLTMEAIDSGKLKEDDIVTVSEHAASMGGSQTWMTPGEQFTVKDMIKCIAVVSANDASVAMGEHIAGSEESFVSMMNERAKELGMTDTTFVNCTGLPAEGHLTSAADILKMSVELLKHEKITEYTTIWMDSIRNGAFGLSSTNKLLKSYNGATGLKTGSTSEALYCLSASAKRGGDGFIAVLMGCPTSPMRFSDASSMLDYGFANYTDLAVTTDEQIPAVPVKLGTLDRVRGRVESAPPVLLEKGSASSVERSLVMLEEISAPVESGQEIGMLTLYLDGAEIAKTPIVAAQAVERLTLSQIFSRIMARAAMRE